MNDSISQFMTKSPFTIEPHASLARARMMMNDHGVRHLPVVDNGTLVGMLSIRDIELMETFKGVVANEVTVDEAMSADVLSFAPDARVAVVAEKMVERRAGSAVISRSGDVLGIFTTTDALNVISELFRERTVKRAIRELPTHGN